MIGTPAPHKRVRFRGAARRAPMLVLAACCVTLYLSASFLLKGLRTGGAAGDGWAYYDDEDDKAGTGGRHRSLGKAEGVDGELDAAFERASHDRRFVSDQHEERAQQAQHAAGGVAGGAAAGLAVQQQGHPVAQEQQQGVHLTQQQAQQVQQGQPQRQQQGQQREPVLVLYSYEERGVLQKASFELFIITAMGIDSRMPQPADTEFAVGVLGQACEPCVALLPDVEPVDAPPAALPHYDQASVPARP